jgi:hypothetical protein
MTDKKQPSQMAMIEKRRIEAEMIKEIYDVVKERHGKDEAREIVRLAVANSAIAQGREFAAQYGGNPTLKDLAANHYLWDKDNALEREYLQVTDTNLDYNITRCEYARMYRDMGLGEIAHLLSCNRDGSFCIGFSGDIELTRTRTIVEGAEYCDFRYTTKR